MSPRTLRGKRDVSAETLQVQLEFRPPLAWERLLAYLKLRAIPGVEMADSVAYRRTVRVGEHHGWLAVTMNSRGDALDLQMSISLLPVISTVISRTKKLFDLGATPDAVAAVLGKDALLAPTVRRIPGLRVAGAFDGFELAVRTVLGQQISVKGASTVAGRWAAALGTPVDTPFPELNRLAPTPETMAGSDESQIAGLGMNGARARCLLGLAAAVAEQRVNLSFAIDVDAQMAALRVLPGIGHWTANYIAMRALHWPDAFPTGDLMLMRAANASQKELQARAESWRPWRSYAAQYLWQSLGVSP